MKKIENNLGKKLKFRKNVEKIGEKKVEKKFRKNSMLVQKNLYGGKKKSRPERAWKKFEKSSKVKKLRKEFENFLTTWEKG